MSKIDKSLSELFGVDPTYSEVPKMEIQVVDAETRALEVFVDPDSTDMEQDVAMIRNNMHALLREGQDAFSTLIHIAKTEEKVSAFEVANAYLSNLTEMNMKLISLHEKKKKMKSIGKEDKPGTIVNNGGTTNIAFVGTTKDILENYRKNKQAEE